MIKLAIAFYLLLVLVFSAAFILLGRNNGYAYLSNLSFIRRDSDTFEQFIEKAIRLTSYTRLVILLSVIDFAVSIIILWSSLLFDVNPETIETKMTVVIAVSFLVLILLTVSLFISTLRLRNGKER